MSQDKERTRYFAAVDGMRGIAAILVMDYHVALYFSFNKGVSGATILADHFYLVVDLFFVMSGFVIAHSFDAKMISGMTCLEFMASRLRRLYPMVVIGVLFGATTLLAFLYVTPQVGFSRIVLCVMSGLLLLPTTVLTAFKPWAFPANSPHWSLSYEMVLSFGYALTFPFLKNRVLIVATACAAAVLVTVAFTVGGLNIGFVVSDYALAFGRVVYPFLIGMTLRRSGLFKPATQRHGYLAVPLILIVIINPIPATWYYDAFVVVFVLPCLVWLAAAAKPVPGVDFLFALAGEISYPLYALHFPIVVAFSNASKAMRLSPSQNLFAGLACAVFAFCVAYVVYRYIDVPIRRYLGAGRNQTLQAGRYAPVTGRGFHPDPTQRSKLGQRLIRRFL
ncbi:acyltransferase [Beijerinckia sp. L45]|uniref:acyltransferase family protein n=1 Tax=Beijerinckia sp. L45 TaxID=1641855 RepID=UPI00131B482D|nr:acyltransferase [Beijerinckia sp. L45]